MQVSGAKPRYKWIKNSIYKQMPAWEEIYFPQKKKKTINLLNVFDGLCKN